MNILCISSLFAALITFAGVRLISRGFIDSSSDVFECERPSKIADSDFDSFLFRDAVSEITVNFPDIYRYCRRILPWFMCPALAKVAHVVGSYISLTCRCSVYIPLYLVESVLSNLTVYWPGCWNTVMILYNQGLSNESMSWHINMYLDHCKVNK